MCHVVGLQRQQGSIHERKCLQGVSDAGYGKDVDHFKISHLSTGTLTPPLSDMIVLLHFEDISQAIGSLGISVGRK